MMMITDREENPPVAVSNSWMDYVGGLHGCYSILQALATRGKDGKGRNIDMAQFECGVGTIGPLLLAGILNGKRPERTGNRSTKAAPQGCYPCVGDDQWCVISVVSDEQWRALVRTIDDLALEENPQLQTLAGRVRHHDEIDRRIVAWTRTRDAREVERSMRSAGVPAEHMSRVDEVMRRRDGSVFSLEPGKERQILMTGLPFALGPKVKQRFGPTPRLGEHTDEALQSWLGLDTGAIGTLRQEGVLS
jgi:crotonobetainyl-CoA:carnitine CoA-transferase CaiB-like acyl-CoA transferase